VVETPQEEALELKEVMLEVLRQLNRAEEERADVVGLEPEEIRYLISRSHLPRISIEEVRRAIAVLLGNGFVRELTDTEYAWTRGRPVGDRFTLTTLGKEFLIREIERTGRID